MSQFLNTDKIYLSHLNPVVSWKGKTLTQITSSIKKNPGIFAVSTTNNKNLFLPNPLKIHRREISNSFDTTNCYPRTSMSIDELNRPNGSIINTSTENINGLVNTLDDNLPNNTCENPVSCATIKSKRDNSTYAFLSPSDNAKRRCRSSGIIKQDYNPSNNCASYYTNSKQYLVSRNKTFLQNQYNYIRVGDPLLKPGTGLAASNIYSPNGLPVCAKFYISENSGFSYQWVDGQYYSVTVPAGYYSIDDFKGVFQVAMSQNYHFLIDTKTGSKVFLINFIYDDSVERIIIQCIPYDNLNFPSIEYSSDTRANSNWTYQNSGTAISPPNNGAGTSLMPGIKINDNIILSAIGFSTSSLPYQFPSVNITNDPLNNTQTYTTTQTITGNSKPGLHPIYKKIYYKPSNSQFGQQGAVSSSSLITRIKYDTINTVASKSSGNIYNKEIINTYGTNSAAALAYGVSENPYTMKDKIGYPNITYPSFLPNSNVQRNCVDTHIAGGVKYYSN
jgi:hypothetical protein